MTQGLSSEVRAYVRPHMSLPSRAMVCLRESYLRLFSSAIVGHFDCRTLGGVKHCMQMVLVGGQSALTKQGSARLVHRHHRRHPLGALVESGMVEHVGARVAPLDLESVTLPD